jgi:hypothetical protein
MWIVLSLLHFSQDQAMIIEPINPETEELLSPGEACSAVPPRGISQATFSRWISPHGVRGSRLATIMIGGRRFTSREAIARFLAAQNVDQSSAKGLVKTAAQRAAQNEAAKRVLEAAGV